MFYKKDKHFKKEETQNKYEPIEIINEESKSILDGIKCLSELKVS